MDRSKVFFTLRFFFGALFALPVCSVSEAFMCVCVFTTCETDSVRYSSVHSKCKFPWKTHSLVERRKERVFFDIKCNPFCPSIVASFFQQEKNLKRKKIATENIYIRFAAGDFSRSSVPSFLTDAINALLVYSFFSFLQK